MQEVLRTILNFRQIYSWCQHGLLVSNGLPTSLQGTTKFIVIWIILLNVLLWKFNRLLALSPAMLGHSAISRLFHLKVLLPEVLFNVIDFFLQFSACAIDIERSWFDGWVCTFCRRNFLYEALIVRFTHDVLQIISFDDGVKFCADSLAVKFFKIVIFTSLLCWAV